MNTSTAPQPKPETKTDPLGYDTYASTLWARIQAALNKDMGGQPLGDDPLVVGIFGEWGAGKSHLLKLIERECQAQKNNQLAQRQQDGGRWLITVPVMFQPWKYEHEDHLMVPLVLHIYQALQDVMREAQTDTERWKNQIPEAVKQHLSHAIFAVGALAQAGAWVVGAHLPFAVKAGLSLSAWLSKWWRESEAKKNSEVDPNNAKALKYEADGQHYYKAHQLFKALSRPDAYGKTMPEVPLGSGLDINFVIFIDDLDRCLPENAVKTLELIKTVFNVESFAFVLALDDEVIERGIGHRYKDYELVDKKPKMPITGFEYLEKIVHLPFRLPPWTAVQAMNFVRDYEAKIQPDASLRWFDAPALQKTTLPDDESSARRLNKPDEALDLLPLALSAFSAYVPRKLIRMVELMQQVAAVAHGNGKSIPRSLSSGLDARVILALVLIQLFQPELYRLLRRKYMGFAQLLAAFQMRKQPEDQTTGEQKHEGLHSSNASDLELWAWARFNEERPTQEPTPRSDQAAVSAPAPGSRSSPSAVVEAMDPYAATVQIIAEAFKNEPAKRYYAQQVRLPIVVQLVEHRAAQRHVFDILKLLQEMAAMGVSSALRMRDYFSFMSPDASPQDAQGAPISSRVPVGNLDVLLDGLLTHDESVRANLAGEIAQGCTLSEGAARRLLGELKQKMSSSSGTKPTEAQLLRLRVLQGLHYLAPHIHQNEQQDFWALVQDCGIVIPTEPNSRTPEPAKASLYLDVQSMLGQDKRFDPEQFYLWTHPDPANTEEKPALRHNFVRFEGGVFPSGHADEDDNKPNPQANAGQPFYMARTLTTVDQFRAFIEDGGYGEDEKDAKAKAYWDAQGWAWRHNSAEFQRQLPSDQNYRRWLEQRGGDLRHQPWGWGEQQRIGSRAVQGITWFEARAYARWLNAQLKARGLFVGDWQGYQVCLPTEWQWEYAARAGGYGSTTNALLRNKKPSNPSRWPWGDDEDDASQRANIDGSNIDHVSVPGCFAPNAAGLLDMAGNLWEWQDGLYRQEGKLQTEGDAQYQRLSQDYAHILTQEWRTSDALTIRGGSWVNDPRGAACSYRYRNLAGCWNVYLGFRVMLSLA